MNHEIFDLAVIGGGSAGYAAARTVASAGKKAVVIEGAETLGGLCILRGCMPSKSLIETGNRQLAIREAAEFGIEHASGQVNPRKVIARKRRLIGEFRDYRIGQLTDGRFELLRGWARFLDRQTLAVAMPDGTERRVKARATLIASGSKIFIPELPGLREAGFLTSDEVLESEEIPRSLVVLGGGAIALEMAHYYEAIGCQLTVIQRSAQLLSGMDADLAQELQHALVARGMEIFCGTKLLRVECDGAQKTVVFEHAGRERRITADEILCALGREPDVAGLNLAGAGVELNGKHIRVDAHMRTSATNIFAAGDVCGPHEVVHIAIQQAEIAAENAMAMLDGGQLRTMDYRLVLYGIFTEPQVAFVGMSEVDAKAQGRKVITASYPFNDHGKALIHGSKHGFVKLIADPESKEILGGSVVGPEGVELIHEIVVAMAFHATAGQLSRIPHYHPTLSEIWTYPAEELDER